MSMSNNKRKLIASAVTAGFVFVGGGLMLWRRIQWHLDILV